MGRVVLVGTTKGAFLLTEGGDGWQALRTVLSVHVLSVDVLSVGVMPAG